MITSNSLLVETSSQCNGHVTAVNAEEENDPVPDEIKPVTLRHVKSRGLSPEVSIIYLCISTCMSP